MFGIPNNDEDDIFVQIENERRNGIKPLSQPRTEEEMVHVRAEMKRDRKPFWNLGNMDAELKSVIGAFIFGFGLATVLFYH